MYFKLTSTHMYHISFSSGGACVSGTVGAHHRRFTGFTRNCNGFWFIQSSQGQMTLVSQVFCLLVQGKAQTQRALTLKSRSFIIPCPILLSSLQEHNKENILQNGNSKVDLQKIFTPATDSEEIKPARQSKWQFHGSSIIIYNRPPTTPPVRW